MRHPVMHLSGNINLFLVLPFYLTNLSEFAGTELMTVIQITGYRVNGPLLIGNTLPSKL